MEGIMSLEKRLEELEAAIGVEDPERPIIVVYYEGDKRDYTPEERDSAIAEWNRRHPGKDIAILYWNGEAFVGEDDYREEYVK